MSLSKAQGRKQRLRVPALLDVTLGMSVRCCAHRVPFPWFLCHTVYQFRMFTCLRCLVICYCPLSKSKLLTVASMPFWPHYLLSLWLLYFPSPWPHSLSSSWPQNLLFDFSPCHLLDLILCLLLDFIPCPSPWPQNLLSPWPQPLTQHMPISLTSASSIF